MDDPVEAAILALLVDGPYDGRRVLVPSNEWGQPSEANLIVEGAVYWMGITKSEGDDLWQYYYQESGNPWMTLCTGYWSR